MSNKQILVSICCITYNHEKFIHEAIDGFLMQQTNFDYEIIIANDCSPDNTDAIVQEYINHHPKGKLIKYFKHEQSLGMISNFIFALKQCTGKYIALCEGDDYWTDPLKLQKQVDFLENNPEYVACCHNVVVKNEFENEEHLMWQWNDNTDITLEDLALGNKIGTLSLIFRNDKEAINKTFEFFNRYPKSIVGDYILNLFLAERGKIKYFSELMGVYRVHKKSNYSILYRNNETYINLLENWLELLEILSSDFNKEIKKNLKSHWTYRADELRLLCIEEKNIKKATLISLKLLSKLIYWKGNKFRLFLSIFKKLLLLYLGFLINKFQCPNK